MLKYLSTVICCSVFLGVNLAFAERPTGPQLFPDSTLAYVRVDNMNTLKSKWSETSFGKLLDDPQISPFFREIYSGLIEGAKGFQDAVGLSIEEVLQIPQGEVAVAVIPTNDRPAVCVLVEANDRLPELEILLAKARQRGSNASEGQHHEMVSFVEVFSDNSDLDRAENWSYFFDQGCLFIANNRRVAMDVAKVWTDNSSGHKPLAQNAKFLDIMSRSAGTSGERPQVSFYVDPLAIINDLSKRDGGTMAVSAMLPVLGIDGIKAAGGSAILAPEGFDSIFHFHILIASPRRAFLSVVRPKEGTVDPETFVPEDVSSYMTINWRTQSTINAVAELFNTFNGEDAFKQNVLERASAELKVDFQKDILDHFDDRISVIQIQLRPARVNSGSNVIAFKLSNAKQFENETLPKLFDYVASKNKNTKVVDIQGFSVMHVSTDQRNEGPRRPDPAVCMIDDRLLVSDSLQALEQLISAYQAADSLLLNSLEYKVIRQRISEQVSGMKICGLTMSRPEEAIRVFYDMAADPRNREQMAEIADRNPFFTALNNALQRHQLPPFDVIRKHLAPAGGFISEDDSGIHYTSFSLKRN